MISFNNLFFLFLKLITMSSRLSASKLDLSNYLKNSNSIIVVCIVMLVLLGIICYKFSKSFMPCGMFGDSCSKVKKNGSTKINDESVCKEVTPQCLLGGLDPRNPSANVLVVNVLSEKMPVFIGIEAPDLTKSISKAQFEELLKANNNQVPEKIQLVYLMCAGWSCNAAKNYCAELKERGVNVSRIVDYVGGLHEWCLYNSLSPSIFKLFHLPALGDKAIRELSGNEVMDLLKNTAHSYNNNILIGKDDTPMSVFCEFGSSLPEVLVPPKTTPTPINDTPSLSVSQPLDIDDVDVDNSKNVSKDANVNEETIINNNDLQDDV